MRRNTIAALAVSALLGGACAKAIDTGGDEDSGAGGDASTSGDSGCAQYDLSQDPKHCGSCTNACQADQVCSMGKCKAQCDAPTTRCASDAGAVCADLTVDTKNCGACGKACAAADAGAMAPGTNNPEAGVPYDGGPGWALGTPTCKASACDVTCTGGMTACSGLCFDTQNHHDRCGDCNTACAVSEWCNHGHCCSPDKMWCSSACIDVLSDPQNCGNCGNVCSGMTPYCSAGKCVAACIPSGTRQAFNTMASHTTTGCWNGQPCVQNAYSWVTANGQSFINANEEVVCGGTTACVSHVGITTYDQAASCQGSWDVYCDANKVGTIDTTNKACGTTAMTNGCSITFMPLTCSTIKLVGKTGSVGACCGSTGLHSMVTAVSAW